MKELQEVCHKEIVRCWRLAEESHDLDLWDTLIEWSNRMTRCAGKANVVNRRITLSLKILKDNPKDFPTYVPAHEAAHIIAYEIDRSRGHGKTWQNICKGLGIKPERYHDLKWTRRQQERVPAYCACDAPYQITQTKVRRIRQHMTYYTCTKCKEVLTLTPIRSPITSEELFKIRR